MKILAIDCTAGPASVAIVEFSNKVNILASSFKNEGLTHSQTLVPMIDEVLNAAQTDLFAIDYFAINAGPGSFTGVRIGVAALKGITALDSAANCIPVSTLESMAYNFVNEDVTVCAAMDARCSQAYTALFEIKSGNVRRLFPDDALLISDIGERLKSFENQIIFVGDGASLCYNNLVNKINCKLAEDDKLYQNAISVALCAKDMLDSGFEPIRSSELLPVYLRAPQAERELKRRNAQ